jgi:hypothetical protein
MRYAAKLARKSPSERATRCAVPAKSLAMSSVFGTWDSPHPPDTIVMSSGAPIHRAYCCDRVARCWNSVILNGADSPRSMKYRRSSTKRADEHLYKIFVTRLA